MAISTVHKKIKDIVRPIICSFDWIYYLILLIQKKISPINVLSEEETIKRLQNGCSISRFGDGEIEMILKKRDIHFQKYSDDLRSQLINVLNNNSDMLLIGMPPFVGNHKGKYYLKETFWWSRYLIFFNRRRDFIKYLSEDTLYGNAIFNRFFRFRKVSNENLYSRLNEIIKIWNNKNVLVVEGENTKLGLGTELLNTSKSISRVLIPNKDCFEKIEDIKEYVLNNNNIYDIVLLVAGPAASVLSYELCKNGVQSIDLGQINDPCNELIKSLGIIIEKPLTISEYEKQIGAKIS